jgi:hypothetical protein
MDLVGAPYKVGQQGEGDHGEEIQQLSQVKYCILD